MKGVIVCPKDVHLADIKINREGTQSQLETTSGTDWYSLNKIDSWVIDENGLLFLPAACVRNGGRLVLGNTYGVCWSATSRDASWRAYVRWAEAAFGPVYSDGKYYPYAGMSVRLVCLAQ